MSTKATTRPATTAAPVRPASQAAQANPAEKARRLTQLRALADSTRLHILELLKKPGCCSIDLTVIGNAISSATGKSGKRSGGMCVCDLQGPLGLTQPTITHHLKVLREAGLVECRKIGPWLYCQRNEKALKELGAAIATG